MADFIDRNTDSALGAGVVVLSEAFGLVFQLVDDLMDVCSTSGLWGKPLRHARDRLAHLPRTCADWGLRNRVGVETSATEEEPHEHVSELSPGALAPGR
ncbi:hypothetical protein JOF53_007406 [Crossiella equi]|uniref:Polyprenyl synthetase n=1 Tax=Crossiella equi TaxID=130796 RepID=A0ABS5APP6_9PSEU|nr:hypothetical protein [Crossiella equi]MBP2478534.1 hypothetical protein [Crossiella equi]